MEKIYANILSLIISCIVTYSLIVPTSHIFGLEDSTAVNVSVDPSESSQSADYYMNKHQRIVHKTSETTSKNEPQKADDANSEQGSTKQSEQIVTKLSHHTHSSEGPHTTDGPSKTRLSQQSEQTVKLLPILTRTPREELVTVTVKVVSSNQIDLKWTGVKDSDLNHYNIYRGTKSSFKVSPGVTVPTGTSTTNSYSLTGLKPSTKYY